MNKDDDRLLELMLLRNIVEALEEDIEYMDCGTRQALIQALADYRDSYSE